MLALFHAKFSCILAISNPVFRWESCKGSVWERVKNCSRLCKETGTRGWILRVARGCKPPEWCTHAKHARSWRVTPTVALQDKSPKLARPFARGLNLWLNPIARSSRQNTLFGKNWLFTFLLTLLYIYPYTHDLERASRENFWERNPREKQDWLIHNLYLKDSLNSSTLYLSIVKSLRGLLLKSFLIISISMRGLFGALESS